MKNIGEVIDKIGREKKFWRVDLILLIILLVFIIFYFYITAPKEEMEVNHNFTSLEDILEYEILNAEVPEKCNCKCYSEYYNKTLSEKYPFLDVRWENRKVDICNDCTLCDSKHTFIVVGGFGKIAILDQTQYAVVDVLRLE